ncbi:MAG TPA: YciI family protein, partial [Candidatus Eisenbacteria bacterium]
MRRLQLSFLILAALLPPPSIGQAQDAPPAPKLFAVEFTTGPAWDHAEPPNEQRHFAEHSKNLRRLRDEGKLPMGARYGDKGLILVVAPDLEAAQAEFAEDPAVTDSVFVHVIHEFSVFYPGRVERPSPKKDPDPPPPTVELPTDVRRVLTDYETHWRAKDFAALAALFAGDGFVMASGGSPVRG